MLHHPLNPINIHDQYLKAVEVAFDGVEKLANQLLIWPLLRERLSSSSLELDP